MKKLTSVLFALTIMFSFANATNQPFEQDGSSPKSIRVKYYPKVPNTNNDRNFNPEITVFYDASTSSLEINCYDEGIVTVFLLESNSNICNQTEFDSSISYTESLAVPEESGTYYLFIETKYSYVEGVFTK